MTDSERDNLRGQSLACGQAASQNPDDWLNADSQSQPHDDLTDFTARIMRDAALLHENVANPTRDQRSRMAAQIFGKSSTEPKTLRVPFNTSPEGG